MSDRQRHRELMRLNARLIYTYESLQLLLADYPGVPVPADLPLHTAEVLRALDALAADVALVQERVETLAS